MIAPHWNVRRARAHLPPVMLAWIALDVIVRLDPHSLQPIFILLKLCCLLFSERGLDAARSLPLALECRELAWREQPKIKLSAPESIVAGPERPELQPVVFS